MSAYTCRICLEECERSEVIAPCSCRGSSKWVHRACLDQWRAIREDRAFSKCTECLTDYHLVARHQDSAQARRQRSIRYYSLVARDFVLALCTTQFFIGVLALFAYSSDSSSHTLLKAFHSEHSPRLFYYFFGLVLFLALVGLLFMCGALGTVSGDCCRDCSGAGCYYCPDCFVFGVPQCECGALTTAECGAECGPLALVLLGVLALVGIFASFFAGVAFFGRVTARHLHVLNKQGLAADFIVKDLASTTESGRDDDNDDIEMPTLKSGGGGGGGGGTLSPLYAPVSNQSDSRHGPDGDGSADVQGGDAGGGERGLAVAGLGGSGASADSVSPTDRSMLRSLGLMT